MPMPVFEVPDRADLIEAALRADDAFEFVEPTDHGRAPIDAVHDPGLVDFLAHAWERFQIESGPQAEVFPDTMAHVALFEDMGRPELADTVAAQLGYWCFETATPLVEGSYDAARASVDVALTALDHVDRGEDVAYGLCRPPGHHAPRSAYGGYCYFNNAAIVANDARRRGREKVAVLDVDYHHGNGTQQIFWTRPDVVYASIHGDPTHAYPYYCGYPDEIGGERGRGATINLPLPAGTRDLTYLATLEAMLERIDAQRPDLVVVSLGLDTAEGDPLGDFELSTDAMRRCGEHVAQLGVDTVIVQEGGYGLDRIAADALAWLRGFASR